MSENRFESDFIGISFVIIDLRLLNSFDLIFNRVFKGNNLSFSIIEITKDGI